MPVKEFHYLISAAGSPNFGDDLITDSWIKLIKSRRPGSRLIVDCLNPTRARMVMGDFGGTVEFVNVLWHMVSEWRQLGEAPQEARLTSVSACSYTWFDWSTLSKKFRKQPLRTVHLLGGGYMNSIWPVNLGLIRGARLIVGDSNARLFGTGLGLMPHALDRFFATERDLRRFDVIDVRDEESLALVASVPGPNPSMTGDDAGLLMSSSVARRTVRREPEQQMVLACIQRHLYETADLSPELISNCLGSHPALGALPLRLVEFMPTDHCELPAGVHGDVVRLLSMWDRGVPLNGRFCIGTRYHFHYIMALLGMPGIAVYTEGHDGYYRRKHAALVQHGSNWAMLQPEALRDRNAVLEAIDCALGTAMPGEGLRILAKSKVELAEIMYPLRVVSASVSQARKVSRLVRPSEGSPAR